MKDKTKKALQIDDILSLIQPFSELGKKAKKMFRVFKNGDEQRCKDYYGKMSSILNSINKQPELITITSSILTHFEDISNIICSGGNRIYELHEFCDIKHFLYFYRDFSKQIKNFEQGIIREWFFNEAWDLLDIDGQNNPSFFISPNYTVKYKDYKERLQDLQHDLKNILNRHYEGIGKELKISNIEGKITISRTNQGTIKHLLDTTYFTIENENFANITLKIKKPEKVYNIEQEIQELTNKLEVEAKTIRQNLTEKIFYRKDEILSALEEIGSFDLLLSKAIFARNHNCSIPNILSAKDNIIFKSIKSFSLPLYAEIQKAHHDYQKIDIEIKQKVSLITGSNMGGKTSLLKTIGQIAYMVMFGLPVPAISVSIKLFDNIFFSGPITQEDRADLSSFGYEIYYLQNVINTSGYNLFLVDEFARGTNPIEGEILFNNSINYFTKNTETIIISATHYNYTRHSHLISHFQIVGLQEEKIKTHISKKDLSIEEKLKFIKENMNYQAVEVNEKQEIPKSALLIAELMGLESDILKP